LLAGCLLNWRNFWKVKLPGVALAWGGPAKAYALAKPQPLKRLVKSSRLSKKVFRVRRTICLGRVEEAWRRVGGGDVGRSRRVDDIYIPLMVVMRAFRISPEYAILGYAETSAHGTLTTGTNREQSAMSFFVVCRFLGQK